MPSSKFPQRGLSRAGKSAFTSASVHALLEAVQEVIFAALFKTGIPSHEQAAAVGDIADWHEGTICLEKEKKKEHFGTLCFERSTSLYALSRAVIKQIALSTLFQGYKDYRRKRPQSRKNKYPENSHGEWYLDWASCGRYENVGREVVLKK
eukprot:1156834-Pelagomonas_calceolata.AAC.4